MSENKAISVASHLLKKTTRTSKGQEYGISQIIAIFVSWKPNADMSRYLVTIIIAIILGLNATAESNIEAHLRRLDQALLRSNQYLQQKQEQVADLHRQRDRAHDQQQRFATDLALFEAYKSFQFDSAMTYARQAEALALSLAEHSPTDPAKADRIAQARCAVAFCFLSAGMYTDAFESLKGIDLRRTSQAEHIRYYQMASRLCFDISDYNHTRFTGVDYVKMGAAYTDSLLRLLPEGSFDYRYAQAMSQMKQQQFDQATANFTALLHHPDLDKHYRAIITSCLGWISRNQGDHDAEVAYLVEAAILDIETATKETTAIRELGDLLYTQGDIERATRYVQRALDDANYYGARQRKIEINNILPIIQNDRLQIIERQRNYMILAIVVSILLLLVVLGAYITIKRQNDKLHAAREQIAQRNRELENLVAKLREDNRIKAEYIGKTFYVNAEYIGKVEQLYTALDSKIMQHKYNELRDQLKRSVLVAERKNMYSSFDEAFLTLFPDFVEQYNCLFPETERRIPEAPRSLTTEMRIFALIRLGISDSERIAKFLDYSVHTINTYKTRVKNKSHLENDHFEAAIMAI